MSKGERIAQMAAQVIGASLLYWFIIMDPLLILLVVSALGDCAPGERCIRFENSGRGITIYLAIAALLYGLGIWLLIRRWTREKVGDVSKRGARTFE